MRRYYPIWAQLKSQYPKPVSLNCPRDLARRIVKAVTNEKSLDKSWEQGRFLKLQHKLTPIGVDLFLTEYRSRELTASVIKILNPTGDNKDD